MTSILMVIVILGFSFLIIVSTAAIIADVKKTRLKIEAALRNEEMAKGYPPGTYSRAFASRKSYKEMKREERRSRKGGDDSVFRQIKEESERSTLENGIKDLESRIDNLDTIIREKNGRNNQYEN